MTLVSAFFTDVNQEKSIERYLELGCVLLQANIPKIIFADETMYENIKNFENENTKIVLTNKEDIYLYKYKNLPNFNVNTTNPLKDTIEFMFIMCNKTEIVRKAIELNYFNTDQFIWIDFGIKHIFNCSDEEFIQKIESLNHKNYEKVRIATIWNFQNLYLFDILKDITWFFAGGVFGGNKDFLIEFADKTKEECLKIIENEKTIMWEVNIWYLVYLQYPHLFDFYQSNHNQTLIDCY